MSQQMLFDDWPERYEAWFATPTGALVFEVENDLISKLVAAAPGELILDAGCGTGMFTTGFVAAGSSVVGLDISSPMLKRAAQKAPHGFAPIVADMRKLPFKDDVFDKAISITALEFVAEATQAIDELFRVTKPGGAVVVATLNRLSSWAERRNAKTAGGQQHVLASAHYRSGPDVLALSRRPGESHTVVHFEKDDRLQDAIEKERSGQLRLLKTGAFVAVKWIK